MQASRGCSWEEQRKLVVLQAGVLVKWSSNVIICVSSTTSAVRLNCANHCRNGWQGAYQPTCLMSGKHSLQHHLGKRKEGPVRAFQVLAHYPPVGSLDPYSKEDKWDKQLLLWIRTFGEQNTFPYITLNYTESSKQSDSFFPQSSSLPLITFEMFCMLLKMSLPAADH